MGEDRARDFRAREWTLGTSRMLRDFSATLTAERVSLEDIVAALGDRGLGVLIAILAVPNIFLSTVPFGNVVTGVPVVFLAVHLMLGWPRLVLPGVLGRRSVSTRTFQAFAPRLLSVSSPTAERVIGMVCLLLSIVSTLPIPFAHMLPALGLCVIGLGLIEHDGAAILLGAGIGLLGVCLLALIVFGLATGLAHLPF